MQPNSFPGRPRRSSRLVDRSGAVLVEFAFSLPILLLIVVGIFDFGFLFQRQQAITNAAREGARMAILPGYSEPDIIDRVEDFLTAGGVPGAPTTTVNTVTVTPAGGGTPFTAIAVTVELDYAFPFLGPIASLFGSDFGSVPLRAASQMRTEVAAGGG